MPKSLFYRNVILITNRACIKRRLVKKSFEFFWALAQEKTQVRTTYPLFFLGSFIVRFSLLMTSFQSVFGTLCISFSRCSLLDIRLFYLCLFLFSSVFLSPYSAYFCVLSNFLAHFSRLALHFFFLAFFDRSVFSPRTCIIIISFS